MSKEEILAMFDELDRELTPFQLQHDRDFLYLLARTAGPPERAGPWPVEALQRLSFTLKDLCGLRRIPASIRDNISKMEVRSFVAAPGAQAEAVNLAARALVSGQVSHGIVSVVSFALAEATVGGKALSQQLQQQMLLHHTDLVCLQGVHAGTFEESEETAVPESYAQEWAGAAGEANGVLWHSGRFELAGKWQAGASLALDLRPFEDRQTLLRVVCLRASPEMCSPGDLFSRADLFSGLPPACPLLVCGDLEGLGGADCATVLEDLSGLRSVSQEVLGDEVCAPLFNTTPDGSMLPTRGGASGMNMLRRPDAILFKHLDPLIALSGHSEHYLNTLEHDELVQQFPAFRPTLVAAFGLRPSAFAFQ